MRTATQPTAGAQGQAARAPVGAADAWPGWGSLPDFPWDTLVPAATRAQAHPGGIVDLSVGTPVDPTPALVREALAAASDAPGYPTTAGTPALREAAAAWFARTRGVPALDPDAVLPTVGSKELVAWLPTLLHLGPGDAVVLPAVAYPTYDVGARLAGATPVPVPAGQLPDGDGTGGSEAEDAGTVSTDVLARRGDAAAAPAGARVRLLWVNSPSNPTGDVLGVAALRRVVAWARERGVLVASDECYAELDWEAGDVPSILDPRVCDGDHTGLLAVTSLSKRSNLAGYRAGLLAGDPALVGALLAVRKHAGMIVPAPVQAAMTAALADDAHVAAQRQRYRARRAVLRTALEAAGLQVEGSAAGLYLWATRHEDCWATVDALADLGVLVAPGSFYGSAGAAHVRVALTATDERVAAAAQRLRASAPVAGSAS